MERFAQSVRTRVLLTVVLSCTLAGFDPSLASVAAQELSSPRTGRSLEHAESLSQAFRAAAHTILPTVVKIQSTVKERRIIRRRNSDGFDPFEGFFGPGFGGMFEQRKPRQEGMGSGVIIRADGLILTNNHVVDGADIVKVELSDGQVFTATDVRTDPETDIAILRLKDADKLPAARLGDSDALDIGDWVLAVGNPFSLEASVSAGIISAKGRSLDSASRASFLQTDAAINPGNSGGPLVNLRGEVIGINTAIASSSGGYQGIGFAVPVNQAKWVIEQLLEKGSVSRAWLGIGIADLDAATLRALNLDPRTHGVLISQVTDGAPAAQAGLRPGDIIVDFAGTSIKNSADLQRAVERAPLNTMQSIRVLRDEQHVDFKVRTEPLPQEPIVQRQTDELEEEIDVENLGLQVADMTRAIARELRYPANTRGVIVVRVTNDGMAARSGLRPGMLITEVNSVAIATADELEQALSKVDFAVGVPLTVKIPGTGSRLLVLRQR
ncbi:MAG: Do family serine endopeptidase [Planctomycetales bacterium]|nr:Do family serine endopeptidase [Planctomycetales bacterium]MCA9166863.1 Do family serine endopeptidase [Planctomycetales bacterium]